jgi:hypothetical protein
MSIVPSSEDGVDIPAEELIAKGYYQVSRNYRLVAKLPDGKTGVEALIDACRSGEIPTARDYESWAKRLGEGHAGDQYLRSNIASAIQLTREAFENFRKLGGSTYLDKHWHDNVVSTSPGCPIDGGILIVKDRTKFVCGNGHHIEVSNMTSFKLLDCSTSHVTPADLKLLSKGRSPAIYGHYEYGAILWVPEATDIELHVEEWKEIGWSDYLIDLVKYAAKEGFARLQLDSDGQELEGLPMFDHTTGERRN